MVERWTDLSLGTPTTTYSTDSVLCTLLPIMPEEPPAFNLTDLDRQLLTQTDEEYIPHDWEDLKAIIGRQFQSIVSFHVSSP